MKASLASDSLVPAGLIPEIHAAAEEEHRAPGELVGEAVERYLAQRHWHTHSEHERRRAHELGLPDDHQPPTAEYLQTFRAKIAQGLQSLRDGKGTDGEVFLAEMDAELAALDRHGSR